MDCIKILVVKEKIGEFKIDENGKSNEIKDLDIGTYYINEILAPHGYQKRYNNLYC